MIRPIAAMINRVGKVGHIKVRCSEVLPDPTAEYRPEGYVLVYVAYCQKCETLYDCVVGRVMECCGTSFARMKVRQVKDACRGKHLEVHDGTPEHALGLGMRE